MVLAALLIILSSVTAQNTRGFYWWTWSGTSVTPPSNTNMGIAFSGWTNPANATRDSQPIFSRLPNTKYISLGGGNANGRWSNSSLSSVTAAINNNTFRDYQGICFDIEEGDSGLSSGFASAFSAAKSKSMRVLVTISHSAPYGITDSVALMNSFFNNANIDYLSPQLYTTGTESKNDYTITTGTAWSSYANARAKTVPSMVYASYYTDASNYFRTQGVTIDGYIQWAQK